MLTKAILTGGVLSVLAGSIVYFGTEGADALESDTRASLRVEETDLAGGADVVVGDAIIDEAAANDVVKSDTRAAVRVAEAEVQDPPQETSKPKTKWLDQYLKKSKPESKVEEKTDPTASEPVLSEPIVIETMTDPIGVETETSIDRETMREKRKRVRLERRMKKREAANAEAKGTADAKGTYVVSEDARVETLDIENLDVDAFVTDGDVDVEALIEELGLDAEKNVQIRVVKKMTGKPSRPGQEADDKGSVDYDMVMAEAKKLLVTDMRNQAFLEIIDHAIDQGDVMQAADIVEALSTPELRDTARARIGVGLAKSGDSKAAFAVLDELEIDELSAPIRLEIITALMATKQERKSFGY